MSDFTKKLKAEELIAAIATDVVEIEQDKVREQRNDFIRICKEWLDYNEISYQPSNDDE